MSLRSQILKNRNLDDLKAARVDKYKSQLEYFSSSLNVTSNDNGRGLIANEDIPAGTVLLQCIPIAQAECSPENSREGNTALGFQILSHCTENGLNRTAMTVTTNSLKSDKSKDPVEYPLKDVFPVKTQRLFPSLTHMVEQKMENPLAGGNNKFSLKMPANIPAQKQKQFISYIQSPTGQHHLQRAVHIARFNSVLAHGQLPFYIPPQGDDVKSLPNTGRTIDHVTVIPAIEDYPPNFCLFPTLSLMNHSCVPNASPFFALVPHPDSLKDIAKKINTLSQDKEAQPAIARLSCSHAISVMAIVRTLKPISKGEEICINYTSLASADGSSYIPGLTDYRQKAILSSHNFECKCERCVFASKKEVITNKDSLLKNTVAMKEYLVNLVNRKDIQLPISGQHDQIKFDDGNDDISVADVAMEFDEEAVLKSLAANPLWRSLINDGNIDIHGPSSHIYNRAVEAVANGSGDDSQIVADKKDEITILVPGSCFNDNDVTVVSSDVVYDPTLETVNKEVFVIQAVRLFDKALAQLNELNDDAYHAMIKDASTTQTDETEGTAAVEAAYKRIEVSKSLIVLLVHARKQLASVVGDSHWAAGLLDMALGTSYHHAGLYVHAIVCKLRVLVQHALLIGVAGTPAPQSTSPTTGKLYGVDLSLLEPYTQQLSGVHPAMSVAFESVMESVELLLGPLYKAQSDEPEKQWIAALLDDVVKLVKWNSKHC